MKTKTRTMLDARCWMLAVCLLIWSAGFACAQNSPVTVYVNEAAEIAGGATNLPYTWTPLQKVQINNGFYYFYGSAVTTPPTNGGGTNILMPGLWYLSFQGVPVSIPHNITNSGTPINASGCVVSNFGFFSAQNLYPVIQTNQVNAGSNIVITTNGTGFIVNAPFLQPGNANLSNYALFPTNTWQVGGLNLSNYSLFPTNSFQSASSTLSNYAAYPTNAFQSASSTLSNYAAYPTNSFQSANATLSNYAIYPTNAFQSASGTLSNYAAYPTNSFQSASSTLSNYAAYPTNSFQSANATLSNYTLYPTNTWYPASNPAGYITSGNAGSIATATNAMFATNAGTATFATNASIAGFATNSSSATFATNSSIAAFATNASSSTFATNSSIAAFSTNSASSTFATNASIAAFATNASSSTFATNASIAATATNANIAAFATNASSSTFATNASIAATATNANIAAFATNASSSTFATNASIAATATNANIAAFSTNSSSSTFATNSSISAFSTNSSSSTFATNASIAALSTNAINASNLVTHAAVPSPLISGNPAFSGAIPTSVSGSMMGLDGTTNIVNFPGAQYSTGSGFTGSGAGLTSIPQSAIVNLDTNKFANTNENRALTLTNTNNVIVGAFTGNGAALTNLTGSNVVGRILPSTLPTDVALTDNPNVFTNVNNFNGGAIFTNGAVSYAFTGNGNGLTNINATNALYGQLPLSNLLASVMTSNYAPAVSLTNTLNGFTGAFTGNGNALTNLPITAIPSINTNLFVQTVNGGATNLSTAGTNTITGAIAFPEYINTSIANGNNADISTGTNHFILLTGATANFTNLGFARPLNGGWISVLNTNKNVTMTFANDSGLDSTAANRILTGTGVDMVVTNVPAIVTLYYEPNAQRWIIANNWANGGNGNFTGSFTGNASGLTNLPLSNLITNINASAPVTGSSNGQSVTIGVDSSVVTTNGADQSIYKNFTLLNNCSFMAGLNGIRTSAMYWGDTTNWTKADFWLNSAHGGGFDGSEAQWDFNLMSFNPHDSVGHIQFGLKASHTAQNFYVASFGSGTLSQQPSDFYGYQYGWSNSITGAGGDFVNTQVSPNGTNGASVWTLFDPTGVVNADANQVPTIHRIDAFSGIGTKLSGVIILDKTNVSPAASSTYNINLGGQQIQEVNVTTALTVAITNTGILTALNGIEQRILFYPGLGSPTMTFSPAASINLYWEKTASYTNAPASIPNSTILDLSLLTQITQNQTNVIARANLCPYTPTIDANAQAFFTAVGGGLSASETNIVNSFCTSAKTHGYFNNLALFYPFVGATSNSCSFNLITPSVGRLAWHSTPGLNNTSTNFATKGVYGTTASNFYADTGWAFTSLSSINSTAMGLWGITSTFSDSWLMGAQNTPITAIDKNGSFVRISGFNDATHPEQTLTTSPSATFTGFLAANRTATTTEQGYNQAGVIGGTTVGAATAFPTSNLYLFALDSGGGFGYTDAGMGVVFVGQNMTAQNMTDLQSDITATFGTR